MPASHENSHFAKKGAVCTRVWEASFSQCLTHLVVMTLRRKKNIIQSICMPSAEIPPQQRCDLGGPFSECWKVPILAKKKSLTELCQSLPTVAGHERDAFWPTWTVNRKKGWSAVSVSTKHVHPSQNVSSSQAIAVDQLTDQVWHNGTVGGHREQTSLQTFCTRNETLASTAWRKKWLETTLFPGINIVSQLCTTSMITRFTQGPQRYVSFRPRYCGTLCFRFWTSFAIRSFLLSLLPGRNFLSVPSLTVCVCLWVCVCCVIQFH